VSRPTVEVADIFRAQGDNFIESHRDRIGFQQLKVMRAIPALPDSGSRWSYRCLPWMWPRRDHLL
jgi:hypothetical protein